MKNILRILLMPLAYILFIAQVIKELFQIAETWDIVGRIIDDHVEPYMQLPVIIAIIIIFYSPFYFLWWFLWR